MWHLVLISVDRSLSLDRLPISEKMRAPRKALGWWNME
jgi:hypothetical protein